MAALAGCSLVARAWMCSSKYCTISSCVYPIRGILGVHADVIQVIGLGAKRYLRKPTDPCDKGKLDAFISATRGSIRRVLKVN